MTFHENRIGEIIRHNFVFQIQDAILVIEIDDVFEPKMVYLSHNSSN